jgi:hypothetical protein
MEIHSMKSQRTCESSRTHVIYNARCEKRMRLGTEAATAGRSEKEGAGRGFERILST